MSNKPFFFFFGNRKIIKLNVLKCRKVTPLLMGVKVRHPVYVLIDVNANCTQTYLRGYVNAARTRQAEPHSR